MTLKNLIFLVTFIFLSYAVSSQSNVNGSLSVIEYPENTISPFTGKEVLMLKEVYKNRFEDVVSNNKSLQQALKHLIRNRIEVIEIPDAQKVKKYKDLPTITLLIDDASIRKTGAFNKKLFNPLKYDIQFFSKFSQLFKIESTNSYLVVKPQR